MWTNLPIFFWGWAVRFSVTKATARERLKGKCFLQTLEGNIRIVWYTLKKLLMEMRDLNGAIGSSSWYSNMNNKNILELVQNKSSFTSNTYVDSGFRNSVFSFTFKFLSILPLYFVFFRVSSLSFGSFFFYQRLVRDYPTEKQMLPLSEIMDKRKYSLKMIDIKNLLKCLINNKYWK